MFFFSLSRRKFLFLKKSEKKMEKRGKLLKFISLNLMRKYGKIGQSGGVNVIQKRGMKSLGA